MKWVSLFSSCVHVLKVEHFTTDWAEHVLLTAFLPLK